MSSPIAPTVPPRSHTDAFQLALLCVFGAVGALIVGLAPLADSFQNGHYSPIGPDSFYHARRILDAVADPASYFQFDTHVDAPGGGLVLWPWLYDYVMSLIVRVALALGLSSDPMTVLVHIPPMAYVLTMAIVVAICRGLRLNIQSTFVAVICTAFFPLNQSLYGIGNIDHHYAEHMFILGSMASAIFWLRAPGSRIRAAITGLILGLAPGIHTAQFVLQVPLLVVFGVMWLRNQPRPAATVFFAIALMLATLAVALPSLALREGHFEYYTLSWFQVYVAACTAILSILLRRTQCNRAGMIWLAVACVVMIAPILGQMLLARDFFTVSVAGMAEISEVQSPLKLWQRSGSLEYVMTLYTGLLLLAPVTAIVTGWKIWREREPARILFWVASLAGIVLLAMQLRLQYFGSFALYLPWLVLLSDFLRERAIKPAYVWGTVGFVLLISYLPGLRHYLFEMHAVAGDPYYAVTRPIYTPFAHACQEKSGTVLADPDDGHYIRFHTDCSVIANPFLVTARDVERTQEEQSLLRLPAAQAISHAPYVRYIYARSAALFYTTPEGSLQFEPNGVEGLPEYPLVSELLQADKGALPDHLRLIEELKVNGASRPYARLFAIER